MRYLLFFAFVGLFSCSIGLDQNLAKHNDGINDLNLDSNDKYWEEDDYKNRDRNIIGLGNNEKENIYRPCFLDDLKCIREFFVKNSNCNPVYDTVPDTLYFDKQTIHYPFAKMSVVHTKFRVKGIANAKISEFYVNKNTGNLVFAIDFRNLNFTSPNAYFRYQRPSKESIVLNDFITSQIESGTFTAVIPQIPHLRLDLAEIHANIDDAAPSFTVGPKVVNQDPNVLAAFARLVSDLPIALQEGFLFLSQLLTGIYIQKNICDFGYDLDSV